MGESTLEAVEQEYHRLAAAGAYADALELATREAHRFPDHSQAVVCYWRMMMAYHLDDGALTLRVLQAALDAGHWYSPVELRNDFPTLNGRPEFERLVAGCTERRAAALAGAIPVLKILEPPNTAAPYPWLVALHGNQSNVESFAVHWSMAVAQGWFVALPQSSQAFGPGKFAWNDWEWATLEIQQQVAAISQQFTVEPAPRVAAGFSMGAGLALWLVLNELVQTRGLILVAPFLPDVERLLPVLEARSAKRLRVYLVASDDDPYCLKIARKLADLLPRYAIDCQMATYPKARHSFPPAFEAQLPAALAYVSKV